MSGSRWDTRDGVEIADEAGNPSSTDTTAPQQTPGRSGRRSLPPRHWRLLAIVLGMISAVCALAIPLLPVTFDTARIDWPHAGDTTPVNAPLTGYWAERIDVSIPCDTVTALDDTAGTPGLLLSTVPHERMDTGAGMYLQVEDGTFTTVNRGQQVVSRQLPPSGCDIGYTSTATSTAVTIAGTQVFEEQGDIRPRVVGIYSDITAERQPIDGLRVSITPDTRYQSSPTVWKTAATIIGALSLIGCLVAVNRLDTRFARRAPRWAPIGWWKLTGRDATVIGALGLWVIIGPVTSDDGYILSMARVAGDAGYLTNYHRWFGVAEAPFGWFYHLTEVMTWVSTAPPWIRLPSFVLAVIAWLLISREILPRLGTQVRTSTAAGWAAAAVFLVWWMPFNNGVRPEPVAAVGALLAIAAVERAVVTRRLLPVCLGVVAAALTLAATPTGLIAVAPFIVAAKPLSQLLRQRAGTGRLVVLAPIAASAFAVLMVVFADQTLATVAEATRLRTQVGPSMAWFQEFTRYDILFGGGGGNGDDSLTRRFPVLLLILCTMTCLVVMLRRGRIPGAALGPSRRLIGTVALFFVLLALTPTKWTHHFGAFAGVGAAMAALTALATSQSVLRSARNRNAFLAALLVVAALATTGPNSYWFVSQLGVPWATSSPAIGPVNVSTMLLLAAVVAAVVALVQNARSHRPGAPRQPERRSRALALSSASLTIVCGLFALSEFATVAAAGYTQRGSYSLATANLDHMVRSSCNMSDHVLVEEDPVANVLPAYPPGMQRTLPPEDEDANDDKGTTKAIGTRADGDSGPRGGASPSNGAASKDKADDAKGSGTKAKKRKTVLVEPPDEYRMSEIGFHNRSVGSDDPLGAPPQGFSPELVPMWSSYQHPQGATGTLRSQWFQLTEEQLSKQLVVSVAGGQGEGLSLSAEYGRQTPRGVEILDSSQLPVPFDAASGWEDARIIQDDVDSDATAVRIVAEDNDLTDEGWIAVTAPRVPSLTTLTARINAHSVYMDWPTAFVYPCLRLPTTYNGISEMPAYRITAGDLAAEAGWSDSSAGGPLGWIELVAEESEVPSFLAGDTDQSWGQLKQLEPLEQGAPPHVVTGSEVHFGWWSPGPGPMQPDGVTPTR